jgi:hypothetical protein
MKGMFISTSWGTCRPSNGSWGGLTYDELIAAHVQLLNRVYDLHHHTLAPTSLRDFAVRFCPHERCALLELRKSRRGESVVLLENGVR